MSYLINSLSIVRPIVSIIGILSFLFQSSAYATESIDGAQIVKLHVYKDYRSIVQLNKGPETPSNGCTHSNKSLAALEISDKYQQGNTSAVEEMYAALLAARLAGMPVDVLTSGCTAFGAGTVPVIIRVIL